MMDRRSKRILTNVSLLAAVYLGVQHYTHHNCIAISTIAALIFIKR